MEILIIGNHTCGNRGDCAILRGLLEEIYSHFPHAKIQVRSRYPESSEYLLKHEVSEDSFYVWHNAISKGFVGKVIKRICNVLLPGLMLAGLRYRPLLNFLPSVYKSQIKAFSNFDLIIQAGGSFFVDLYGYTQFEGAFTALLSEKPLVLIGHSMGPFNGWYYRLLSKALLTHAKEVVLRESFSIKYIIEANLPTDRLSKGCDTAWLVNSEKHQEHFITAWNFNKKQKRPLIGITIRELAPFDQRLGITQAEYETAFARLVSTLISAGYDVLAVSMCTGIQSYHRDDRINALRIQKKVADIEHFHVLMDELNDVQIGFVLKNCELLIGTRLHSAIVAMNFGTPSIAINYEHKSEGIMSQLGLPYLAQSVQALIDGSLDQLVLDLLRDLPKLRRDLKLAVSKEKLEASLMVKRCIENYVSK